MYDDHYFKSGRKSFRFIRKKTEDRSDTEIVNLGGIGEIGEMSSVFTDKKGADLKTYPVAKRLSRAIHRAGVSALQWRRMAFRLLDEVKMAASSRRIGPTAPWNVTCPAR